jgi:hypothetical protein
MDEMKRKREEVDDLVVMREWERVVEKRVKLGVEENLLWDSAATERLRRKVGGQLLEKLAERLGRGETKELGSRMRAWAEEREAMVKMAGKCAGVVYCDTPIAETMLTISWKDGDRRMKLKASYRHFHGVCELILRAIADEQQVCAYRAHSSTKPDEASVRLAMTALDEKTATFVVDLVCGIMCILHPEHLEDLRIRGVKFAPCIKQPVLFY